MPNLDQININITDTIPPENFATIDKNALVGTVYTKAQDNEWRADVEATTQSGIKGVLKPDTPYDAVTNPYPTPWAQGDSPLYEKYDVNQPGSFPNTKDINDEFIVVTQTDIDFNEVQIWIKNGIAEKVLKAMPQASVNIRKLQDVLPNEFPLLSGDQVVFNGGVWVVKDGEIAENTDIPNEDSLVWVSIGGKDENVVNILKTFLEPQTPSEVWIELNINQSHYQANSFINQAFGVNNNNLYDSGGFELAYLQSQGFTKIKVTGDFDEGSVLWLCGVNNSTSVYDQKVSGVLANNEYIIDIQNIYEFYGATQLKGNTKFYGNKLDNGLPQEDAVLNFINDKTEQLENVLDSFLNPTEIQWTLLTFPTPGDTELPNKFAASDFAISNSTIHNVGLLRMDFLADFDYIKMEGGMLASGGRQWLWRQDLSPTQIFESKISGVVNDTRIIDINHEAGWDGYGYTRNRVETKMWVGKKIILQPEQDSVRKAINEAYKAGTKSLKDKIYNGEVPNEIAGFSGMSGEATVLKFKGQTLLYCTEGWLNEIVTVHDYNVLDNSVSNRQIIANTATTSISGGQTFKCSCFFVVEQKVYMVCSIWNLSTNLNYCLMMQSTDGRNFTVVSDNIADSASGFKPTLYGNHWILPEKINGYYYWFIEGTNSSNIWQMKLMKSLNITSGWELVGTVEGLNPNNGAKGGPCVYFADGKFKMVYHYAPIASNLPTYLAFAESNINDPLYFTPLIMPLMDVVYTPYPLTDQVADPELFELDGKTYLICTIVDNSNAIAHLHRWECDGRLYDILQSRI